MTLKIRIEYSDSDSRLDSDLVNLVQKFIQDSWDDKIIICDKTDEDYESCFTCKKDQHKSKCYTTTKTTT